MRQNFDKHLKLVFLDIDLNISDQDIEIEINYREVGVHNIHVTSLKQVDVNRIEQSQDLWATYDTQICRSTTAAIVTIDSLSLG